MTSKSNIHIRQVSTEQLLCMDLLVRQHARSSDKRYSIGDYGHSTGNRTYNIPYFCDSLVKSRLAPRVLSNSGQDCYQDGLISGTIPPRWAPWHETLCVAPHHQISQSAGSPYLSPITARVRYFVRLTSNHTKSQRQVAAILAEFFA